MESKIDIALLAAALFASGCSSGGADDPSGAGNALVGKQAPEIQAESVGGEGPTSVGDARGKVAIVDFWATYCDPCRKSFPVYQQLVDKHSGGLAVIGVSVDDPDDVSTEDVKAFATELSVTFPIVWDKEKKTAGVYNPPKMPTSYVIDKQGVVRFVHAGYQAEEADKIAAEVDELMK
ncbi:MAG TPA: TlpA disulfide reductase family protein [Polyangiaceae bacterium]|nr:TlpA disulfide reductase family protein [Polyangiaceae bacterium]